MKRCKHCQKPGPFSPSKVNKDGLQSWCKKCKAEQGRERNRAYMRSYRNPKMETVRKWLRERKAEVGCRCGERDFRVLDFHHRDPREKSFGLGESRKMKVSLEEAMAEAEKCDVLCANCHRREHFKDA